MNYQDRIVCFLDILGFREHISQSLRADGSDSPQKIEELAEALSRVRDIFDVVHPEERPETEITQFSDSIVLSFLTEAESGVFGALLSILWVQIGLVTSGILCRGGVARGKLIHTPKLLFGPAMVDAYLLESRAALYPRVILDESIIEAGMRAHARHHRAEHEQEEINQLLCQDADGMYYVDYVTKAQSELDDPDYGYPEYLGRLQEIISAGLKLKNPSTLIKYQWLKNKFAPYLKEIKRNLLTAQDIEEELRAAYQGIPDL
jgi:hypothetical protein